MAEVGGAPVRSVSRPSSKTWRKRSQIGGCAFSNSSSSRTANGCLRTEAISGRPAARRVRVAEEPLEALGCLVLAHVESDQPVRGAEEELRQRFRDLRLAGAGGADEEEDAERAARIGEAGLDEGDPVDEAFDRLRLAEHAALEERAHVLEAKRSGGVENGQRQPRQRRERGEDVAGGEVVAPVSIASSTAAWRSWRALPGAATPGMNCCASSRLSSRTSAETTISAAWVSSAWRTTAVASSSASGRTRIACTRLATLGRSLIRRS